MTRRERADALLEKLPMSEMLRFFSVQIALLAVVLILHTYLGLHVIRRTLIFSDLVLDQLAAFGAMVGIAVGVQYGTPVSYVVSLGFVLLGAAMLALIKPARAAIPREAAIGILYAMALVACLLLSDKLSGGGVHLTKTLTGCMLWVTWPLVATTFGAYALLIAFHYWFRERFIALVGEAARPDRAKLWDFLFFTTQGIITVLIVPIAGVLLAYALLMIPAAIAAMFRRDWGPALLLGWSVGLLACLTGLVGSYYFDWPYSPSLILSLGVAFLGAVFVRIVWPRPTATTKG